MFETIKTFRILSIVFCLIVFPALLVYPEGTKQLMPNAQSKGQLCINKFRNDFAFYDAAPEYRINISVADTSERIRFGFGKVLEEHDNVADLVYRIKSPDNVIVSGPFPVPASGAGFIDSYTKAVTGPFPGGYNYLEFKPGVTGDYYIEFYYTGANTDIRRYLEFFDITVLNAAGNAEDGRVWSKAWHLWSGGDSYSSYDRFYGKMMVLSDDSIVTQVDCNGFQGGRFSFSGNMTGCNATGILTVDRMSTSGFNTYPQYKVFLNDPDNTLYPTQKITSGIELPVIVNTNCNDGSADFEIKVKKDGTIKILIQVNPAPGADPEDVQLIANIKAQPGGSGYNIIHWDGKDNLGRPVASGTSLLFSVTNLSGLTNLPIFDIENNDNGFIVTQIRPAGGLMTIYWDDSNIGGISNATTGCNKPAGCHTWNNEFGNNNTINTWWFVSGTEIIAAPFITKRAPGPPTISGDNILCEGVESLMFSAGNEPNSTSYTWSYSGNGATIESTGLNAKINFLPGAIPGAVSVQGHNASCYDGVAGTLDIIFEPLPQVALASFPETCFTAPGFRLTGGQPGGGTYYVDGVKTDSLFPYKLPEGSYSIVYNYTAPVGCSNSDTASILLYNAPECDGTVFFPDAFSPNSDNLNDLFRPVVENIYSFSMYIFSRWGQLVFSTNDPVKGWDGKYMGVECPTGDYTYQAIYAPSLRSDTSKTTRGMFVLIR